MMLEQSLINPNFIGRDGFRWFIGMVANTKPDQWAEYGTRAQVRIFGYHGEDVKESDLPWAHVLVPLTMGGGQQQVQGTIQTSSLVIGFFADGDDGQQPIVIGSFYTGAQSKAPIKFADGSKYFTLFKPQKSPINPYNIPVTTTSKTGIQTATGSRSSAGTPSSAGGPTPTGEAPTNDGELLSSVATESFQDNGAVSRPGHCADANKGFNKVLNGLKEFIKVLNTVNQVTNGFVNPVLNKLSNLDAEIQTIGILISDWISTQIKWTRDEIIKTIYNQLKLWLNQIKLPPWAEKLKKIVIGELTDGIWCAIGKILKKIFGYVINFLTGLVGNIVSFPLCAAEAFLGSAIETITNEISSAIGPLTDQISSIIGSIGEISSYVNQALGYARSALTFLICDDNTCKEYFDYEMNVGHINTVDISNFQTQLNLAGSQGVSNLLDDVGGAEQWLGNFGGEDLPPGVSPPLANCNVFSLECGPPTVSIFGGGGSGASGNAVIDSLGGIIGVNLTNSGSGYSDPPYVRFEDSCNNGRGAYGVANIGVVSIGSGSTTIGVTGVTIYYPGGGYLGPNPDPESDPCKVPPFDSTGSALEGTILTVKVDRTGIGYSTTDKIYDAACINDIEMYPIVDDAGRIVDVNVVNPGTTVNVLPNLQINSENGFGAVLIPTLTFKPISGITTESNISGITTQSNISGITTETNRQKVKKVVYCAEDHV